MNVVGESRESACVDAAIPLEPGSRAAIGFEGDLVLVLEQVSRGGDAVTSCGGSKWMRRVRLDGDLALTANSCREQ